MKYLALILLSIFLTVNLTAQSSVSMAEDETISSQDKYFLYMKTSALDSASKPFVWNDYFILVYPSENVFRYVGVAFEHENYSVVHNFIKNENNVYTYSDRIPNVDKIKYRLVVDSTWQEDYKNSNYETDKVGIKISVLDVPNKDKKSLVGVKVQDTGLVDFYYRDEPNSAVFLNGSFSNWDPFLYKMEEIEAGIYHIAIPLSNGNHYYTFFSNGKRELDPSNLVVRQMGSTGEKVNEVVVNLNY